MLLVTLAVKASSCPHAHKPLPPLARLDFSVATQVLRRGGLKNGPKLTQSMWTGELRS